MRHETKQNIFRVNLDGYNHGDTIATKNHEYIVIKKKRQRARVKNINNIL